MNICIIHYNTPELTEALVKSINKQVKGETNIYVFDNSDQYPFTYTQSNLVVFDNTKGQLIDFEKELSKYPDHGNEGSGKCISFRHCISVDKCFDLIGDDFILLDSDILLKKDISPLWDEECVFVGKIVPSLRGMTRLAPFLCFIGVKKCIQYGIRYFNPHYMHGLCRRDDANGGNNYDTGAAFLMFSSKYHYKEVDIYEYIVHYRSASWNSPENDENKISKENWLLENKEYYCD